MHYLDFHCDTLMKKYDCVKAGDDSRTVYHNDFQIDLERLIRSGYGAQFFACYIWATDQPRLASHFEDACAMADILRTEAEAHADQVAWAGSWKDYLRNREEGRLSCFLTVEEGGILEGDLDRLKVLYDHGIRLITLTWNYENCIGYPNTVRIPGRRDVVDYPEFESQVVNKGLKPFGFEVLERMEDLGMIIDVSHLSDGGFYDVCRHSRRPFIASHSNARTICPHPRNLTDEMIRMLADRGGVTGLNFCGAFLSEDGKSTLDAMMRHIRHLLDKGGREFVALGTDFDGIEDDLEVMGCQEIAKVPEAMARAGFTDDEIEAVCWRNAEKFLERYFG